MSENIILQQVNDLNYYILNRIEPESVITMIDVYKTLKSKIKKCASKTKKYC